MRWAVLSGLVVLDAFLTRDALEAGYRELNPLLAPLAGTPWLFSLKVVAVSLLAVAVALSQKSRRAGPMLERGIDVGLLVYAGVTLWHAALRISRAL